MVLKSNVALKKKKRKKKPGSLKRYFGIYKKNFDVGLMMHEN